MKLYQVDAFTERLFGGNPAAVCPVDRFPADELMQNIGMENNLAETAFIMKTDSGYDIRWFTPTVEVDLCGHATLASAHVIYNYLGYNGDSINFNSQRSGLLKVYRNGSVLTLDFPTDKISQVQVDDIFTKAMNSKPVEAWKGKTDLMLVFENETAIRAMAPNFGITGTLPYRGVIVTAKGDNHDFVSRFFGPQSGIDEDPATGSAHTTLIPYWSKRLGKKDMKARQLSKRGADLVCKDQGDRVHISGSARTYMVGEITI
jgi:PhzF family phenazine biosynthesis protein